MATQKSPQARSLLALATLCAAFVTLGSAATAGGKDAASLVSAAEREFRNGAYDAAITLFSQALTAEASASTYFARSKAHLKKNQLPAAIADLTSALEKQPGFMAALLHRANLYLMTGRCKDAVSDYSAVLRADPSKRDALSRLPAARECAAALERAEYAARDNNLHARREALSAALEHASQAPTLRLARAEVHLALGSLDEAVADTAKVLKVEAGNLEAYVLRATALTRLGDYAAARTHYQQCLQFDPESRPCKDGYRLLKQCARIKEKGDAAIAGGRWGEAAELWQEGLLLMSDLDARTWRREALPKLAKSLWKKGDLDGAERAARAAVAEDDGSATAHHVLGEVLLAREAWEEASREGHRAHELDRGSHEFRDFAQRADAALKQSKQKDYYRILGVPRNANDAQIKRAYRAAARQWHPDVAPSQEERETYEAKFRDIAEAHDVLSTPEKRQRYDRGEEVDGPPQGHGPHGHPFHPFGGGGFPFGGGGGGPGGFTFTFRTG